jgi:hypothetical protein
MRMDLDGSGLDVERREEAVVPERLHTECVSADPDLFQVLDFEGVGHPSHQPHLWDETRPDKLGVESTSRMLGWADGWGIGLSKAIVPEEMESWDRRYRLWSLPDGHRVRRATVAWTFLICGRAYRL